MYVFNTYNHKYRSCYSLEHFIIAKKNVLQPELFLFRSGSRSGSSVRISAPGDGVDGNGSDEEYNGNFLVFKCAELALALLRIEISSSFLFSIQTKVPPNLDRNINSLLISTK